VRVVGVVALTAARGGSHVASWRRTVRALRERKVDAQLLAVQFSAVQRLFGLACILRGRAVDERVALGLTGASISNERDLFDLDHLCKHVAHVFFARA
jgi:hypothetical protein